MDKGKTSAREKNLRAACLHAFAAALSTNSLQKVLGALVLFYSDLAVKGNKNLPQGKKPCAPLARMRSQLLQVQTPCPNCSAPFVLFSRPCCKEKPSARKTLRATCLHAFRYKHVASTPSQLLSFCPQALFCHLPFLVLVRSRSRSRRLVVTRLVVQYY